MISIVVKRRFFSSLRSSVLEITRITGPIFDNYWRYDLEEEKTRRSLSKDKYRKRCDGLINFRNIDV